MFQDVLEFPTPIDMSRGVKYVRHKWRWLWDTDGAQDELFWVLFKKL